MTVESNYVIAITTLIDWLKHSRQVSTNEKQNQNQSHHVRVIFPALRVSYRWLLGNVIGSSRCLLLLWLVGLIALVLVFRQSFENRATGYVFSLWPKRWKTNQDKTKKNKKENKKTEILSNFQLINWENIFMFTY